MLKKIRYRFMSTRGLLLQREFCLLRVEELSSWPLVVYAHSMNFVKHEVNAQMRELQDYIIPELERRK